MKVALPSKDDNDVFSAEINEDDSLPTTKSKRVITNDDIKKYHAMVEKYLRDSVVKNWNEASLRRRKKDEGFEQALGNSGYSIDDFRQHLYAEVVVALHNYNPDYVTPEGKTVKESTFVFQHLFFRTGQLMKRLTNKANGYGVWMANLEKTLWETDREE